ncbi:unnamed protein product [Rotaria magnacalcarata]|uniref:NAD(P)(+)--arginine ADP-ribosyltransferase n=2 Tax=Rotaria magnacalcarata TaxID=392030 RepID=A0A816U6S6_9BILA|nr:unnamed protein product [Rotaria magnacalcarata]
MEIAYKMTPGENLVVSRVTDLLDEPVTRLLASITDYEAVTLFTLEESVKPVIHLFDGIEKCVLTAKENSQNSEDGLNQDESASIYLYTMQASSPISFSHVLNKHLRSESREVLKPWFYFLKLFFTALHKLPSRVQTIWRGVNDVDLSSEYPPGSKVTWWGVSSCLESRKILESEQFLGIKGLRTLFSIECQNGKSIVAHSFLETAENEIILMPGTCFEVIKQVHVKNITHIIFLREIQSADLLITPPLSKVSSLTSTNQSSGIVTTNILSSFI